MKVLVIGSGAKEHSIIWKLSLSKRVSQLFCTPGNPGIQKFAQTLDITPDDINGLCTFARNNGINLTVVCSDVAATKGIVDLFKKNNLLIFGPTQAAALFNQNRVQAKKLIKKYNIKSVPFAVFDKENQALEHIKKAKYPLAIKYDSKAGNGCVFICETPEQARRYIENCFENLYKSVIIEEILTGCHVSYHIITDGYNAVPLSPAQSYKRAFDRNAGPYTSGMGAYAPVTCIDPVLEGKIAQKIIFPLLDGLNAEKAGFSGVLNAEILIDDKNEPHLIEYGTNFSSPETEAILPLLEDDLLEILYSTATDALGDDFETFNLNDRASVSIILASGRYPGKPKKGSVIEGLESIVDDDINVFQGGISLSKYYELITTDERVLTLVSTASTLSRAYEYAYDAVNMIDYEDKRFRSDIAKNQINKIECLI